MIRLFSLFAALHGSACRLAGALALAVGMASAPMLPGAVFGERGASWVEIGGHPTTVPASRAGVIHGPAKTKLRLALAGFDPIPSVHVPNGPRFIQGVRRLVERLPAGGSVGAPATYLQPDATGPPPHVTAI